MKRFIATCLMVASATMLGSSAHGADVDEAFFRSIEGKWSGPGEILAGKFKGTKFNCRLQGTTPGFVAGMKLDGSCTMGLFSQTMTASVVRTGSTYQGEFYDGSGEQGLDIVSGSVVGNKVIFSISRNELDGIMLARVEDDNNMNVTISVEVDEEYYPVIDMNLKRVSSKK